MVDWGKLQPMYVVIFTIPQRMAAWYANRNAQNHTHLKTKSKTAKSRQKVIIKAGDDKKFIGLNNRRCENIAVGEWVLWRKR